MKLRRLKILAALPPDYRSCLAIGFLTLIFVRLGLSTVRYNRLSRTIPHAQAEAPAELLDRLGWCIPRAAKAVWGASCLTQALAMQLMLARRGYRAELRVGARRDADGAFHAHAWLNSGDRIVLGGSGAELATYAQFNTLSASHR